jgi:hypothetical protein
MREPPAPKDMLKSSPTIFVFRKSELFEKDRFLSVCRMSWALPLVPLVPLASLVPLVPLVPLVYGKRICRKVNFDAASL